MLATYIFNETSPAAPGTSASSQPVESSASWAASGVAAGILDDADALDISADLVGATGGTLDIYVQYSPDTGRNWYDLAHFPQLAAGAAAVKYRFGVGLIATASAPVVVGKNLSPALAASTVVQGPWGDRLRLVFVAGASTTAGAPVRVTIAAMRSYRRP